MRLIALLFLLIGAGLAGGAVYFMSKYVESLENKEVTVATTGPELVQVVAAKKALKHGDRLDMTVSNEYLQFVQWPKAAVPEGAFLTRESLFGIAMTEFRTVLASIEPGEALTKSKVTEFGITARASNRVADGMRAVTIPVDTLTGVAGHVSPQDRVDIGWFHTMNGTEESSIILTDIRIIATDEQLTEANRARANTRTVTVEVTPKEAQYLLVAQRNGSLVLLLRGYGDTGEDTGGAVSVYDLPGMERPKEPEVAPPVVEEEPEMEGPIDSSYRVRVRKGNSLSTHTFEDEEADSSN